MPSSTSCCLTSPALSSPSRISTIRVRPWPYISITAETRSSADRRATGSGNCSTCAVSSSTLWMRASGLTASGLSAGIPRAPAWAQDIPVGVWVTFRTCPPRWLYMWTPHGRHGSKLRTARMMSTPLKFSGPFSSKIGVFCTASS